MKTTDAEELHPSSTVVLWPSGCLREVIRAYGPSARLPLRGEGGSPPAPFR